MDEFRIGTYPPMCPRSIFIDKKIKSTVESKKIVSAEWQKYYTGRYSWHGDVIPNFDKLPGSKIIFADASFLLTDTGLLVFYAYLDGGLRLLADVESIPLRKAEKSATNGYLAKLQLDDGSCLCANMYGWATLIWVKEIDLKLIDYSTHSKYKRYPFLAKSYIDAADDDDFTYERFCGWLSQYPGANIIEACATAKGALRIDNYVMNYILLLSKIHPKTKVRTLSQSEITGLYNNTKQLIGEYKSGVRVCAHTDIFGNIIKPENDIYPMNSASLGTPCPICGTLIQAVPAAGTKMYFCPECQVLKK